MLDSFSSTYVRRDYLRSGRGGEPWEDRSARFSNFLTQNSFVSFSSNHEYDITKFLNEINKSTLLGQESTRRTSVSTVVLHLYLLA